MLDLEMAALREEWRGVPAAAKALVVCGGVLILVGLLVGYGVAHGSGAIILSIGAIMLGLGNVYSDWAWRRNRRAKPPA